MLRLLGLPWHPTLWTNHLQGLNLPRLLCSSNSFMTKPLQVLLLLAWALLLYWTHLLSYTLLVLTSLTAWAKFRRPYVYLWHPQILHQASQISGARFHFLPSQFLLILGRNQNSLVSFLCHQLYSTGPVVKATSLQTFDMIWFSSLNIYCWTIGR